MIIFTGTGDNGEKKEIMEVCSRCHKQMTGYETDERFFSQAFLNLPKNKNYTFNGETITNGVLPCCCCDDRRFSTRYVFIVTDKEEENGI